MDDGPKSLISATLSPAAAKVWQSWPKKNKKKGEVGRSAQLSILIAESSTLLLEKQALGTRVGHLQGQMASYRANLQRIIRLEPPYDRLNKTIIEGIIPCFSWVVWIIERFLAPDVNSMFVFMTWMDRRECRSHP